MKVDEEWLNSCFADDNERDMFFLGTHWRMLLVGTKHSGMFLHGDILRSSSWQLQVRGNKRWFVCAPSEAKRLVRYTFFSLSKWTLLIKHVRVELRVLLMDFAQITQIQDMIY
jgi:hypothetical protein